MWEWKERSGLLVGPWEGYRGTLVPVLLQGETTTIPSRLFSFQRAQIDRPYKGVSGLGRRRDGQQLRLMMNKKRPETEDLGRALVAIKVNVGAR